MDDQFTPSHMVEAAIASGAVKQLGEALGDAIAEKLRPLVVPECAPAAPTSEERAAREAESRLFLAEQEVHAKARTLGSIAQIRAAFGEVGRQDLKELHARSLEVACEDADLAVNKWRVRRKEYGDALRSYHATLPAQPASPDDALPPDALPPIDWTAWAQVNDRMWRLEVGTDPDGGPLRYELWRRSGGTWEVHWLEVAREIDEVVVSKVRDLAEAKRLAQRDWTKEPGEPL